MRNLKLILGRSLVTGCVAGALALMLGACASQPAADRTVRELLHDDYFPPSGEHVDAADVFAFNDAMQRFVDQEILRHSGPRNADLAQALVDALQTRSGLKLQYDAGYTRNAAQAFDARAGNCLSLVIMTAAFAKHLGLPVSYQRVFTPPSYSQGGGLVFSSGHVNLRLSAEPAGFSTGPAARELTVDFLPPTELGTQRTERLPEHTIVSMFLNNRAAEALSDDRLADSYAWARAAVIEDPAFGAAANTLGVVYLRSNRPAAAEAALRRALVDNPDDVGALGNLVTTLRRLGRTAEAQALATTLARIQPEPPFQAFDLGREAMRRRDYLRARLLFERELQSQPDQPEVHFWAALADWQLGDLAAAAQHLRRASDFSTSLATRQLYVAKLAWLHARQVQ